MPRLSHNHHGRPAMSDGADHRHGGAGADLLDGKGGDDMLRGFGGADTLYGGGGDDRLGGGAGTDILDGGAGDDSIRGGLGGDSLSGGEGADTFRYRHIADSLASDHDIIGDFETGVDRLVLRGEFKGFSASDIHIVAGHYGGVVITIAGTDFMLESHSLITIDDIVF